MNILNQILFTLIFFFSVAGFASDKLLVLEGDLPGQYAGGSKTSYVHGAVVMYPSDHSDKSVRGLIKEIVTDQKKIDDLAKDANVQFVQLKRGSDWDVIYPGLIDLHNHTKQNNLGVWDHAHGQFANRFEWRAWSIYKKSVSGNMNPWIGFGKAVTCAAFRWSEIQAMSVGTTYLQGPSSCVNDFAIHQVENGNTFHQSNKKNIQAPTDLVIPGDMTYVWNTLRPEILKIQGANAKSSDAYRLAYETALAKNINEVCDTSKMGGDFNAERVRDRDDLKKYLTDQDLLKEACENPPEKFIRYVYWVHKSVIGKKTYAESLYSKDNTSGDGSAIIAHLAEGRRTDAYNTREFEIVKLLGMDQPHVNFVHGVGIDSKGFKHMADNQMGLIWSPFSNMLLYNETLDVAEALKQGVMMALGSDWLPTGSKGPLEELKIAAEYIDKTKQKSALSKMAGASSADEALYKMVTENPAKMINHWQTGSNDADWENGEAKGGVGTIAVNAMGSLIVTSKINKNPFTNLVREIWETDVNLVVVDGKIQYGNVSYLDTADLTYEVIPNVADNGKNGETKLSALRSQVGRSSVLMLRNPKAKKAEKEAFLEELADIVNSNASLIQSEINCDFSDQKGFVHQDTKEGSIMANLNIDRFRDIQRLIGINLMTQSRNRNNDDKGDPEFEVAEFTPLYTCDDEKHFKRVNDFISKTWPTDTKNRAQLISDQGHGNVPARMADKYPQ